MDSEKAPIGKGRLILGGLFFLGAQGVPFLIPVISDSSLPQYLKSLLSGVLLIGVPELGMVVGVAIWGREGYEYLWSLIGKFFKKYGPAQVVGPTRYRIGLFLFTLPVIFAILEPYNGTILPHYETHRQTYSLVMDLSFVLSFFVLGGEFWDKIRALFVYRAQARFPKK